MRSLKQYIQQQTRIPFVEFMQLALYSPVYGYYSSSLPKLGTAGDFVTAPEWTPLFGRAVARQCAQVFTTLACPNLLEFGGGRGRLCVDILKQLDALDRLPNVYYMIEVSAHLRQCQAEHIQETIPHLASRVQWLSHWPEQSFEGVVLANEVLDAMPVHRFLQTEHALLESYISLDRTGAFQEEFRPCANERLRAHVATLFPKGMGMIEAYQSEANLMIDGWIKACSEMLTRGALLIFDYGFPRHEYYHPERKTGTLMCHYQHQAHTNPFAHPGEEDITAHVDFTHVAQAGHDNGFHVAGYTNQAAFLLSNGILDDLASMTEGREKIAAQQAVKQLLQAHEMGELFKVLALTKQVEDPLNGFVFSDKRASL